MKDDPIIATEGMGRLGRIAPGTALTVRKATAEEIAEQWKRLDECDDALISPYAFLVCWADDPTKVLTDWFSPVGGWFRDAAVDEARKYAAARGARLVDEQGEEIK